MPPPPPSSRHGHGSQLALLLLFPITLLLLLLANSSSAQLLFQLDGPQPCPNNPIRLMAQKYAQYIYSPFDEHRLYPPDTDCQFLIEASDNSHRIHLTVLESDLEEALFTECNDFVSVRDREGNETVQKEIVRWCGQADYPAAITSATGSIFVHFHSDSVIQKRGFNISFVQFELPGCPPEWDSDSASPFCYKQFVLPHILPWFDSQKECNFERANLAVFQNDVDYGFIVERFSQTHSFPWIGYSDANMEGLFEATDRSSPLWPENFPLKQENEMKDCVYLDWNKRDQFVHYEIDDCRNRRPFLCKKRKDGSEVPVSLPSGMIRRGFRDFSIDYTLLVGVIVLLLLVLIVVCVIYQKFKERTNRVVNVDLNQRFVQQQQGGGSSVGSRQGLAQKPLSAQKAAAAASLAKEKLKERERKDREQRYEQQRAGGGGGGGGGKNVAKTTPPNPLESQESAASFPLQTFEGFSRSIQQIEAEMSQRREVAQATGGGAESPLQSPRISLSPNQPDMDEKRGEEDGSGGRKKGIQQEEEDEGDRHNMGYEPDSEDEESGRVLKDRRTSRREDGEGGGEEEGGGGWREEEDGGGRGGGRRGGGGGREEEQYEEYHEQTEVLEFHREEEEKEHGMIEQQAGLTPVEKVEGAAAGEEEEEIGGMAEGAEMLGKFAQTAPAPTDHPLRPPIELMRGGEQQRKKEGKEEGQVPQREGTMFSTGMESGGTGTGGTPGTRMRARRKSFDRPPPVGPLDSVSAISLDEFWEANQK